MIQRLRHILFPRGSRHTRWVAVPLAVGAWVGLLGLFSTLCLAVFVALAAWSVANLPPAPVFADMVRQHPGSYRWVLDRDQRLLSAQRVNPHYRQLPWLPLAGFAPQLQAAVVQNEDQRFFGHAGVDWQALGGSAFAVLQGQRRGGSTLTMQLVRLLAPPGDMPRTTLGKWNQMTTAWQLERHWSKAQILEAYLNLAPLRSDVRGLHTGAALWFNQGSTALGLPQEVSAATTAWLVALLPAPQAPMHQVSARACRIALRQALLPSCDSLGAALPGDSRFAVNTTRQTRQHLLPVVHSKSAGVWHSRVSLGVQQITETALADLLDELKPAHVRNAAAVVLDNASGDVLAYVGSAGPSSGAASLDVARALRQPASAIKPLLYAAAFDAGRLHPSDWLPTRPKTFAPRLPTEPPFRPRHEGPPAPAQVHPREALGGSMNVPAVQVLQNLGIEPFAQTLLTLKLAQAQTVHQAGLALALGAHEVSLLNLTNAYRSLANGGVSGPVRWVLPGPSDPKLTTARVFTAQTAALVTHILADPGPRNRAFGEANPLNTAFASSAKTGTSNGARDNWALGYTGRHTVGVWIGNADGQAMRDVLGPNGAAIAWRSIVENLHRLPPEAAAIAAPPFKRPLIPFPNR